MKNDKVQLDLFGGLSGEAWSYSRLKTLRRCALEYKNRWLGAKREAFQPMSIDVIAGRMLHTIVRDFYSHHTLNDKSKRLMELYDKHRPHNDVWLDDLLGEARSLTALRLFSQSSVASYQGVAFDVSCRTMIGNAMFVGQADMLYRPHTRSEKFGLIEFKLTDAEVSSEEPEDRFLQCIIYYLGLPEAYRRPTHILSIYVFDSGMLYESKIDTDILARATQLVEQILARADGPDYPPTPNLFCGSCGNRAICPAFSKRI